MRSTLKQHSIPFFKPALGDEEISAVSETLRSGWLTTGPRCKEFEAEFTRFIGVKHAIAVNSCTAALHLAYEALGLQSGDKIALPSLTFASTAEVAIHLGARPLLIDCDPHTFTIDLNHLEHVLERERPKVISVVHYGGQPCPMKSIEELAARYSSTIVEDAAHALPASDDGRRVGTGTGITCFSFYANKTITTGEGGMITTQHDAWAERMRLMSLHGISKDAWKRFSAEGSWYYEILAPGYKYNMTDLAAAIGLCQLMKAEAFRKRRAEIAALYDAHFASTPEIMKPYVRIGVEHAWHLYVIQLDLSLLTIDRATVISKLNAAGIGVSVHYLPLHMHPYYRDVWGYQPHDLPQCYELYQRIISLPIYPSLTDDEVAYVANTLIDIVTKHRV